MINIVENFPYPVSRETNTVLIPLKKDQYALRAIFELAKQKDKGPIKISDIAAAQSIPVRFLEVILNQLKGSGLVDAKRGFYGGYYLVKSPDVISVGDVLRYFQIAIDPSECSACVTDKDCPHHGNCAFSAMWMSVKDAAFKIFDETSIQDLIDKERMSQKKESK